MNKITTSIKIGIVNNRLFHFNLIAYSRALSYCINLLLEALFEAIVTTDSCCLKHCGLCCKVQSTKLWLTKEHANSSLQEVDALYKVENV